LTAKPHEEAEGAASEDEEGGEDEDEEVMVIDRAKESNQGKGKKRTQEEEDAEKPKKKAKGVTGQPVTESAVSKAKIPASTSTSGLASKSGQVMPVEIAAPQRSKNRKSLGSELTAPVPTPTIEPSADVAESTSASSAKKRSQKSASTAKPLSHTPGTQTPTTDEPTTKAASKKKSAAEAIPKPVSTPAPATSLDVYETKPHKTKKAQLSVGQVSDLLPTPQPAEEPLPKQKKEKKAAETVEPITDKSLVKDRKKGKKLEKAADAPAGEAIAPSLTKDELKQKRSATPGEKKKSKINSTLSKSTKERVLGKKATQ